MVRSFSVGANGKVRRRYAPSELMSQNRFLFLCRIIAIGVACPALIGYSLQYEYSEPDASAREQLQALIEQDLEVDTSAIPDQPPSDPVTIAQDHHHGKYFVPARVNGRSADLMLGWGSWVTLGLMPYMVRRSNATLSTHMMPTSALEGESEMRTGRVDLLRFGDAMVHDVPFAMANRDLAVKLGGLFTVYRGKGDTRSAAVRWVSALRHRSGE